MESHASRTRRDPVARFNTFEEAENEIKAQIQNASQTQRAIRARTTLWQPKPTPLDEAADGLQPAQILVRGSKALDCAARSESVHAAADLERHSLERTFSFNSLSTLQRDAEAARLSQWRDSPVSAFSPTDRTGCVIVDEKVELQDTCPPISVIKLKQIRKDEKEQRKSAKKQEKEQKKADKAAAHKRRHSMATPVDASGPQSSPAGGASDNGGAPRRAISDPSFKASREAAVQLVKKLTAKPMNRLSRRSKVQRLQVPHVDDFPSKPDLQQYLNSDLPEPDLPIAELPGPLPPYTPFQNSTANEDNSPAPLETINLDRPPVQRTPSAPGCLPGESAQSLRMMRCDLCEFGIKLDEKYLQCSICNNGDRIICIACDAAGCSCRHELTERTRKVLRYDDAGQQSSSARTNTHRRHDIPWRAGTFGKTEEMHRHSNVSHAGYHSDAQTTHRSRSTMHGLQERQHLLDVRDLEIRKREQDLIHKERECLLREREAVLQERQARLREREAEADTKSRLHQAAVRTHTDFVQQCSEMATFLGSQFASLQAQLAESSRSMPTSPAPRMEEDDINLSDDAGVRSHAAKRKASGKARAGSTTSPKRSTRATPRPAFQPEADSQDEDEEDGGSGTPKKMKHDPESATSPGKLYACHFCKHNSSRYSERNNAEKQYRGCSSGYWPDISRLKQHLYRVHWRGHHCERCFGTFKKPEELQQHSSGSACQPEQCPYPEKFNHLKYNEIRKKRPTNTPEEVWYIIYDILFPGDPRPATPYADSVDAQVGSFSSPSVAPVQPTWDALGEAFESRLDQHQDVPNQAWLRLPGAREFIREQLRASMADVFRHLTPAATPAATPLSTERSPRSANHPESARRQSIPVTESSMPASPIPLSATSSRSTSSLQWRLPNHRRSFSRPIPPQTVSEGSERPSQRPVLTLETVSTPSEITFAVPTPGNPENDRYDDECNSWHQNDDSLGLAITTDDFDFEFQHSQPADSSSKAEISTLGHEPVSAMNLSQRNFEFRPVKVSSLAEVPTEVNMSKSKSIAVIDSAYGSLESHQGNPRPSRQYVKSTIPIPETLFPNDGEFDTPVPEHELNMEALKVPFQEFLGAEMDECGNIDGRSLTEYLYG